jgi:hypothetical protein
MVMPMNAPSTDHATAMASMIPSNFRMTASCFGTTESMRLIGEGVQERG